LKAYSCQQILAHNFIENNNRGIFVRCAFVLDIYTNHSIFLFQHCFFRKKV
jgi:hypothetical protein